MGKNLQNIEEPIIAAIATAYGEGGIAVVRISGEGSVALADKFYCSRVKLADAPPRYMCYGKIIDERGEFLDEVLAVRFEARKSYTGEEALEIQCHGGYVAANACLELVLSGGARLAGSGEFTRRAFTNGRIDISQANAVIALIKAKSAQALKAAGRTLQGKTAGAFQKIFDKATHLSSHIEAILDYPDEEIPPMDENDIYIAINELSCDIEIIKKDCTSGMILNEGIAVSLTGRPNVGKSSLLNALMNEEKAIVTPIPGTTRDVIEGLVTHKGVPLRFADTAGIQDTQDIVETAGVQLARRAAANADVCCWVTDSSCRLTQEDIKIAHYLADTARPIIAVMNKADIVADEIKNGIRKELERLKNIHDLNIVHTISLSALTSQGTEELKDVILQMSGGLTEGALGVSRRQLEALANAQRFIDEAARATKSGSIDAAAAALADCRQQLAQILGINPTEELLDDIFSRFCIGK